MHPSLAQRVEAWWDTKPLASQLVTLITFLLAVGLSLSGTVMIGLLQRHLTSQIDDQLIATAHTLQISASTATFSADGQGAIPTLYYIQIRDTSGNDRYFYSEDTLKASGTPNLPELIDTSSAPVSSFRTLPITVSSSKMGLGWRALVVPVYEQDSGQFSGYMTIALPLSDMQHTLRTTASYFAVAGSIIVLIGGWAGRVLVRRALLPLRSIESTAGKIAAGDLTKRVTPHPPTTEVGSLSLSLNAMLTQVEQSFEARQASEQKIKRFVSDASHELRTPLAAISGYCELYSMGGVPTERIDEVMGRIGSESARMANLVEDLLTLARLDEGRPLEFTEIDLVKLADNAVFDLQALDPTRTVGLTGINSHTPPMTLIVSADRDRISQVFTNLIGNIVRYTPEGSPVEIALGRSGDTAIVELRDHGPGIDETDRGRVFERFYRADTSRNRKSGGSGLGLAIATEDVAIHGGRLQAYGEPGKGASFLMTLPKRVGEEIASRPLVLWEAE